MKKHIFTLITKRCVYSKPVIDRLDQVNTEQNADLISTFDFSTLYTKLPHKDLLFDFIDFGSSGGSKKKN